MKIDDEEVDIPLPGERDIDGTGGFLLMAFALMGGVYAVYWLGACCGFW